MTFVELNISGVVEIIPDVKGDERGGFFRSYCQQEMDKINMKPIVQMNHSFNVQKGTLRGLHYQKPPHQEQKLIRCVHGAVWDVFVDLRKNSPTFLQWDKVILSAEKMNSIFIPEGMAHGFITLENNSELIYAHTAFYQPQFEAGLSFDDEMLNITWPTKPTIISDRDRNHPHLSDEFKGIEL